MTIDLNLNGMDVKVGNSNAFVDEFQGNVIVSDIDESGTSKVRNIVVLSQASYNALTPNSETLYFIT